MNESKKGTPDYTMWTVGLLFVIGTVFVIFKIRENHFEDVAPDSSMSARECYAQALLFRVELLCRDYKDDPIFTPAAVETLEIIIETFNDTSVLSSARSLYEEYSDDE